MIDIDRLRTVNDAGVPLARTTVTELLDALEQTKHELTHERVITMAAAFIVNNISKLHKADRDGYCEHCTAIAEAGNGIKYPCPTKQIMEGTK